MPERLVLKNAVDCTNQHFKWTSGARVMTIFGCFTYTWSFLLYLSIGHVLDFLVLKNVAQRTSQRSKWTSGARVMTIFGLKSKLCHDFLTNRLQHYAKQDDTLLRKFVYRLHPP